MLLWEELRGCAIINFQFYNTTAWKIHMMRKYYSFLDLCRGLECPPLGERRITYEENKIQAFILS